MQEIFNAGINGKCVPVPPSEVPTDAPMPEVPTTQAPTPEVPTTQVCNGDKLPGAECSQVDDVWVVNEDIVIESAMNLRIETSVIFQGNVNVGETITFLISSMATLTFQKCPTFNDSLNIVITEVSETLHTVLTIPPNCDVSVIDETTVTSDVEDECSQFSVIETQTKLSVLWATDRCNDSGLSNGVIAGIAVAVVLVVVVIAASLIYYFTFHGKRTFVI
mmetsp:Transcript_25926/g.28832  ORF Transcript_25926/g.28832 Transcript_25926/m.28832 type:complete len:220 (+) Transcript_25926:525-1184(+)